MSPVVGIDLGTTNSAVAHVGLDGRPVVLRNRLGQPTTPSVICFREGRAIVGQEAKDFQAAGEPNVAAFFKRQMGHENFVFRVEGNDFSAVDLSAIVLKSLKEDAECSLGQPVSQAVITVPAYFRNPEREATIAAGKLAGLEIMQIINEPTAAAVAYGIRGSNHRQKLMVYDLGGGTFDVTLLDFGPEEIRILASAGDHELGGKDWDDRIVQFLACRFEAEHGSDPFESVESLSDLLVRAEEVKRQLSARERAGISLVHEGKRARFELDRSMFEEMTADLMERTIELCRQVLSEQSIAASSVDGVLLVGGSSRMPMVHRFIEQAFGKPALTGVNVDEAVALGAAITSHELLRRAETGNLCFSLPGKVRTVDVTNHSLGMIAINDDKSAYVNTIILPKNLEIPCRQVRPYQHRTRAGRVNSLEVYVTQGESSSPRDVAYVGRYLLEGITHVSGGMAVIDIEYSYDASGTVQVGATLRQSGIPLHVSVKPLPQDVPARFLRQPEATSEVAHVTAYLAFDLSGSMSGQPIEEAKKAARGFLKNTDLGHCSIGIVAVADTVNITLNACQDARKIESAIEALAVGEVGYGNSGQPFSDLRLALAEVGGPRFVITLADGVWSNQDIAIAAAKECHVAGIESIAVGFGSADRQFLKAIASADEGSFFTTVGGLVETFSTIAQVLTESGSSSESTPERGKKNSFLGFLKR